MSVDEIESTKHSSLSYTTNQDAKRLKIYIKFRNKLFVFMANIKLLKDLGSSY